MKKIKYLSVFLIVLTLFSLLVVNVNAEEPESLINEHAFIFNEQIDVSKILTYGDYLDIQIDFYLLDGTQFYGMVIDYSTLPVLAYYGPNENVTVYSGEWSDEKYRYVLFNSSSYQYNSVFENIVLDNTFDISGFYNFGYNQGYHNGLYVSYNEGYSVGFEAGIKYAVNNNVHECIPNIPSATCTENVVCTICGVELQAILGHNYNFWGKCKRDGCGDSKVSNWWSNTVTPWWQSNVSEPVKNDIDDIKDWFSEKKEDASDTAENIKQGFNTVLLIIFGIFIIVVLVTILPLIIKFFDFLSDRKNKRGGKK